MDPLTAKYTTDSIDSVRKLIARKNSPCPDFATNTTVLNSVTDYDHYPYTRWFRGVYYYPEPIVAEREAGWRPIHNDCYSVNIPPYSDHKPKHCFQAPCSTTFPCYPQYLAKYSDKEALDVMINEACIPQYR